MVKTLTASVSEWVRKSEAITHAVIQTSAQRLMEFANLDGPSIGNNSPGKGGRMPRVTGFLKNSARAQIGSMPAGPRENGSETTFGENDWRGGVTLVIAQMKPGDVLFMGWSAVYARKMEQKYGFMKGAALEWQRIVDEVAAEAKARIGG